MKTSEEVAGIFEEAKALLDSHEPVYGDSWKKGGFGVCFPQVIRKANYLKVQRDNGFEGSDKFFEDLLDLMNWCTLSIWHLRNEVGK